MQIDNLNSEKYIFLETGNEKKDNELVNSNDGTANNDSDNDSDAALRDEENSDNENTIIWTINPDTFSPRFQLSNDHIFHVHFRLDAVATELEGLRVVKFTNE